MFQIKKGIVHGYEHNAPRLRDKSVQGIISETVPTNSAKIKGAKAFNFITGKHNAPDLVSSSSKSGKSKKFGS